MDSWIHCNKCLTMASAHSGGFWFTSCGHIICNNCVKRGGLSPDRKVPCLICQSVASIIQISRTMKPDLLALFKNPRDLLAEYTKRMKSTIDFQTGHRNVFQKKLTEKCEKAVKFAKTAQSEIAKKSERERALVAENKNLTSELNKSREYAQQLEQMLAERDHEIHRLRKSPSRRTSPYNNKKKSAFPSLNGDTPINSLSFLGCATSTPNEPGLDIGFMASSSGSKYGGSNNVNANMEALFRASMAQDESPLAGPAFTVHAGPTTPSLLGIGGGEGSAHRHTSGPTRKPYF